MELREPSFSLYTVVATEEDELVHVPEFVMRDRVGAGYAYALATLKEIVRLYREYAPLFHLRLDVAFAQALHETDHFRFGGLVQPIQYNFAGIGAVGPGYPGLSFRNPEAGVIAHLAHLAAYVHTEPVNPYCNRAYDPRYPERNFANVRRVRDLSTSGWAADPLYAEKIVHVWNG